MRASRSLPLNPQATAVGIRGTVGTIRTASPEGIGDGVLGKRRAVAAEGVARRVGFVQVRAQLAAIVPLLVIEPWRVRRKGVRRRLIAERTAVRTKRIVDAVRFEWAAGSEGIGRRVRIKRIGAQITEIFGRGGERKQQEQEEEKRHRVPLQNDQLGSRLLPIERRLQAINNAGSWNRFLTPFSLPLSRAALAASAGAHCWAELLGGGWINYRGNFGDAVYGEAC